MPINMRFLTLLLSLLLTYGLLRAQEVSGTAFDDQGKPLAGASVTLKRSKDSSVVKLGVSNTAGEYQLIAIPSGQYFVNISHIGYTSRNSAVFQVEEAGITLAPSAALPRITGSLKEAVITAGKPLVEVK